MRKKSESLLTLESERNFEATQKDPSSPARFDSYSILSSKDSYDNSHMSDTTDSEQDEEIQLSLSKNTASLSYFDNTLKKISEKISDFGTIITYDVDFKNQDDNVLKYSSKGELNSIKLDLRNSRPLKKFSGFLLNLNNFTPDDQKRIFLNISNYSRPVCKGVVLNANKKSIDFFTKSGFSIVENDQKNSIYYLEKNEIEKVAGIEIRDNYTEEKKAWFACDKADTLEEKIAGLQIYPKLKYGSGLLFPYSKPQDVMYHMGEVDFPIDIAFIDNNGKIKKICKNIQPGALGTFGSSGVSAVLEVLGESLDKLGVNIGDKVSITNFSNNDFEKYSSFKDLISEKHVYHRLSKFSNFKYSFENYDIVNGTNVTSIPSIYKKSNSKQEESISIYDFDSLIFNSNSNIKLFKKISKNTEETKIFNTKEFLTKFSTLSNYNFVPNKMNSFSNFLALNGETNHIAKKMIFELIKSAKNNDKIIFVTRSIDNVNVMKQLILKRAEEEAIIDPSLWSARIMNISEDLSPEEIISFASHNFGGNNFKYISESNFSKVGGIPIPDKIKEKAREAYDDLKKALDQSNDILEKLQQNSQAFDKLKEKPEQIKSYKGLYQQSCRRNAKRIFDFLSIIKKSLKTMNSIKDISSVTEKIDALTTSCSQYVTAAEEIFALVEKVTEPEIFLAKLTEMTTKIEKSTEDIQNNINNFVEYISQNILNQKVLSK
jgi:uncharacterized membrane protein (UPF0127 family)